MLAQRLIGLSQFLGALLHTAFQYFFVFLQGFHQFALSGQQLTLRFDPARVDRLLRQANEPVWGLRRPLVLLWWVDERNGSRQLMGESTAAEQWQQLSAAAVRRGLPLMLPLMDLDDSMAVASADLQERALDRVSGRRIGGRFGHQLRSERIARDSSNTGISPTATMASEGSAASPSRSSRAKL